MTCSACGGVHSERLGERVSEYVLVGLLGSGGMASVYEARHTGASRGRVAIKIPHPCHRGDSALRTRFSREARASAVIHAEEDQENVISVLADGLDHDGTPYVVLRRLFGRTLKQWLGERKLPMDVSRAVDFVLDAGLGLHAAHTRGIIHRDVKPANLFVARAGAGTEYCVLLDFGVAKFLNEEDTVGVTGSNGAPGTPGYMALEQFFGAAAPRSDVYALGSVLYELLANEPLRTGSLSPPARGAELEARWHELGSRRSDVPPSLLEADVRRC